MSYYPITIQRQDPDTELWVDLLHLHALKVNKAGGGESFNAGAGQYHPYITFEVRWCKALDDLRYKTQSHRIIYRGHTFDIKDYDDYMEQHLVVKLSGEAYG